jgi:hypothetical protein
MQRMNASQDGSSSAFAPCTCSTDYLVICGRASARPMDAARATLEALDSSKHIIAQLSALCNARPDARIQVSASYVHESRFCTRASDKSITFGLLVTGAHNAEIRAWEHPVAGLVVKGIISLTDFIHVAMPAPAECGMPCAQESSWLRLLRPTTETLRLRGSVNRWA